MFSKTNIPESTSLTGRLDFGDTNPLNDASIPRLTKKKQYPQGNRCGHDCINFKKYEKPPHQKRRFHVIEEALRIIQTSKDIYDYPMFHGLMFHANKNGRLVRSERREAELSLLLPAIIDTVNLYKMELGYFDNKGEFINFDYNNMVTRTGMNYSRVERNMRHLQDYGLITITVIPKKHNDGYITERVIIKVLIKLFEMLKLDEILQEDCKKALKNRKKQEIKINARSVFKPKDILKKSYRIKNNRPQSPVQDKQVIALILDLIKSGKYQNSREALIEACRLLGKPPPN